jgi:mannan endo-1,4-beta-mannosidase
MKNVLLLFLLIPSFFTAWSQQSFVTVKGHQFYINNKPYYYAGTNYWYGSLLALLPAKKRGIERLQQELDFLKARGITNLRILAAVEGTGFINGVQRVQPAFQTAPGIFDESILFGLDAVLYEMGKRNMKAVLFISNNWEWSGGFLQYLHWEGLIADSIFRRKLSWDEQRDYTSKFYSCSACKSNYQKQLTQLINRSNSITGKKYTTDPTIMAWEIANEPRPMRAAANTHYLQWIHETTTAIKQLDPNHLVTLGHEGMMATDGDKRLYQQVHALPAVDYLTIHIWPKNWGWITGDDLDKSIGNIIDKTNRYINDHLQTATQLDKPLVIEEFGLPRDGLSFSPGSSTVNRDLYYKAITGSWKKSKAAGGAIAGFNCWAFTGIARPIHGQIFWKEGDDLMGDPPMEEQGLNSVFDTDSSTWKIISVMPVDPEQH